MNKINRNIYGALLKLKATPNKGDQGICPFIGNILYDDASAYNVEGNRDKYADNHDKWNPDTKFGAKRLALVSTLIHQLQKELS